MPPSGAIGDALHALKSGGTGRQRKYSALKGCAMKTWVNCQLAGGHIWWFGWNDPCPGSLQLSQLSWQFGYIARGEGFLVFIRGNFQISHNLSVYYACYSIYIYYVFLVFVEFGNKCNIRFNLISYILYKYLKNNKS